MILAFNFAALVSLLPVAIRILRGDAARDAGFWILFAVAIVGPGAWSLVQISGSWQTGLSSALWLTVFVSLLIFAVVAAVVAQAWRLTPMLITYLFCLGVIASIWQAFPGEPLNVAALSSWVWIHILVSVVTYALFTLAAVASLGAFLQERALKTKNPTNLTRMLPSVVDSERLTLHLLIGSEIVLGLGLITGMIAQYMTEGTVLAVDHKVLLSFAAFVVIGILLIAHLYSGTRGRRAMRLVMLGYLLLTLGYPGVKFVTDVLLTG